VDGEIRTTDAGHSHRRELLIDGEMVSRLWVLDGSIWLMGVPITFGGLAGVHTEPKHRRKGHNRRLMEDTVDYMTSQGWDVSLLFGIPDFYNKFGYAVCLADQSVTVPTRDAERAGEKATGYTVRAAEEGDFAFIARLHNESNKLRSVSRIRDETEFRRFPRGSRGRAAARAYVVQNQDAERVGYAACDDAKTEVRVVEVNATERAAFPAIVYHFAQMAVAMRCGEVEFFMPLDHPFTRYVMRYGCRTHGIYHRMGGGMMRILNQESLFGKLRPALQRRVGERSVHAVIKTELGTTELKLGPAGGEPLTCRASLPQSALTQLVVGYRQADDVLGDEGVESEGDAEGVLDVLFGGQHPFSWQADCF